MRQHDWPSSALRIGGPRVSLTLISGFPGSRHGRQEVSFERPRDERG
jgi:hypothetical protein